MTVHKCRVLSQMTRSDGILPCHAIVLEDGVCVNRHYRLSQTIICSGAVSASDDRFGSGCCLKQTCLELKWGKIVVRDRKSQILRLSSYYCLRKTQKYSNAGVAWDPSPLGLCRF